MKREMPSKFRWKRFLSKAYLHSLKKKLYKWKKNWMGMTLSISHVNLGFSVSAEKQCNKRVYLITH